MEKIIRQTGNDGKERILVYNKDDGYLFIQCQAKDFHKPEEYTIIGNYKEPNAQDLIEEVR